MVWVRLIVHISIHTLHTEGDCLSIHIHHQNIISIHTLHTEGDLAGILFFCHFIIISIHTLHTEGDEKKTPIIEIVQIFQSTPSTRRVT